MITAQELECFNSNRLDKCSLQTLLCLKFSKKMIALLLFCCMILTTGCLDDKMLKSAAVNLEKEGVSLETYGRSAFTSIESQAECDGRSWQDKLAFYVVDWPLLDLKFRIAAAESFLGSLFWFVLYLLVMLYGACFMIFAYILSAFVNAAIDIFHVLRVLF